MRRVWGAILVLSLFAAPRLSDLAGDRNPSAPAPSPTQFCSTSAGQGAQKASQSSPAAASAVPVDPLESFQTDPLRFLSLAPADSLALLPGIGPVLAARIAATRANGKGFSSLSDLERVHGIGPKTVARLQQLVRQPSAARR